MYVILHCYMKYKCYIILFKLKDTLTLGQASAATAGCMLVITSSVIQYHMKCC